MTSMPRRTPRRLTARRLIATVAGLAATTLALSGCFTALIPVDGGPDASTRPDPMALEEYFAQDLRWSDCGRLECAYVAAPLDWESPETAAIWLSVVRSPAAGGRPIGSLLTNPGGPGASGVDLIVDSMEYVIGQPLIDAYDVIGFDPRGVGGSTAVQCLDATEMDAHLFDVPEAPRGTPEWEAELDGRYAEFADACQANSDGILEFITTENAARDMQLLHTVLGDEQLNYLGFSYGTFLGATYAKLFPESVGRLVLDGAIDPSASGYDVSVTQAIGFENALRAYMASCLTGADCPFRGTVEQAMGDLAALLASVDRSPLPATDGRMLGADSLVTAIITPLYSEGNWPALTGLLADALQGDPDYAFYVADLYFGREDGRYVDNSTEAFRAYNCMDYPTEEDPAADAAATARIAAEAPTVAPYWDGPDLCAHWAYPPSGVREKITAPGAAPIVVVGSTGDPATPYEWSVALAEQLESGVLVTRRGEGHTGYLKGDACVDAAVEDYLIDGVVPADGACG